MQPSSASLSYDYSVAKLFTYTMVIFGIIGMLVGVLLAFQMAWPAFNLTAILGDFGEYVAFGRLRPLHTNGIIYGFMLSGIWAAWYYISQRVLKISFNEFPFLKALGYVHFWLYVVILALAVVTLFLGITQNKEYIELAWPIDLLVVVLWVVWGLHIWGSIGVRREKSLYISLWYFIATFLAIAMLYITNNLQIPTWIASGGVGSIWHSVSMYSGTNDGLIQWWWGHNAVAFVFTSGVIALVYYFMPKEAGAPVYSYKLSLYSFWSLMFVYLWAGGHHLIYSTVPDWMQTMGSVFSVVLILPSWGTAINFLLTLRGQWHQVTTNPIIKMLILASVFYMFSTLEGPIQSIKSVNALAHFTDWIIGHVHDGVLGWVCFSVMAATYHMVPRMYGRKLYSAKLIDIQFWIQTTGIVLYFTSMWIAGITQGMMWRDVDQYGGILNSFISTVHALHPYYVIRSVGGVLYFIGFLIFVWNVIKSITSGDKVDKEPVSATPISAN
ncbi:MAG: cytochrome-c oxidase, cbb3-type subunit I [Helicobacteraceae bacterium]|jgi:cytochrome c oxidase cbb3-type subunit 1|nr:cytochrome-c oxidase, cbb3-type subunit I [Helicobacteraceae bacterium]